MSAHDLTGATMHRRVAIVRDRPLGVLALTAALVAAAMLVGAAYSGSSATIAAGVEVDGVEIGGLAPAAAVALLEHKSARLAGVPVVFEAGKVRVSIRPDELGVSTDWAAAVETAQADGRGVAILQGFRRLELALLGGTSPRPSTPTTPPSPTSSTCSRRGSTVPSSRPIWCVMARASGWCPDAPG